MEISFTSYRSKSPKCHVCVFVLLNLIAQTMCPNVYRGTFSIVVSNDDGSEKEVGKYVGSGSFGELALMYNMPRAATVRAITIGSLWAMVSQSCPEPQTN